MATFSLVICVLVGIAISTSFASPIEQDPAATKDKFIYLGSTQNASNPKTRSGVNDFSETIYMLSTNAVKWTRARQDCVDSFGDQGSIVNIETKEELENLSAFLDSTGEIGMRYWTGGKYDMTKKAYSWDNGVPFGSWVEWQGSVLPLQTARAVFRRSDKKFLSALETTYERYICEVKMGEEQVEVEPCYSDNDLTIIVDSSGSVGQQDYMTALEFVARLGVAWADNSGNRLSVIVFSSFIHFVLEMRGQRTSNEVRDAVYDSPYFGGGTATSYALDAAVDEIERNPRSVPKNIVLITDGISDSPSNTLLAAARIQNANIRAISVGVGSLTRRGELLAIAGNNENRVFTVDGFDELLQLLIPVSRLACE